VGNLLFHFLSFLEMTIPTTRTDTSIVKITATENHIPIVGS